MDDLLEDMDDLLEDMDGLLEETPAPMPKGRGRPAASTTKYYSKI